MTFTVSWKITKRVVCEPILCSSIVWMKLCCFVGRPHNRTRDSKISMNHSYTLQSTFHYAKIFRKVGKSINRTLCSNKIFPFLSDGTGEKTANCAVPFLNILFPFLGRWHLWGKNSSLTEIHSLLYKEISILFRSPEPRKSGLQNITTNFVFQDVHLIRNNICKHFNSWSWSWLVRLWPDLFIGNAKKF